MGTQKYYPMQGSRAFETTSMPIVETFRISASANTAAATTVGPYFPIGSMSLGFVGRVTTAFTSTGSATLTIGFLGTSQLSADVAKTSIDAIGDIVGPTATESPRPLVLTADDSFDIVVGTTYFSAGNMDVHVTYVPPPDGLAGTIFKQYAAT